MPAFALTASWLKIASAGQAVEVQNLSAAPILITTSNGLPATPDGLLLDALDTRIFALVADLYARTAGTAPGTVEVMGGFILPGAGNGTAVPFAMGLPTITGTLQLGQVLSASQGAWSGSPTSYAYQWGRNGAAIAGATASTYTVQSADLGAQLTVTVTASNAAGSATATSVAITVGAGSAPGGGSANAADFADPNNAYLAALAA